MFYILTFLLGYLTCLGYKRYIDKDGFVPPLFANRVCYTSGKLTLAGLQCPNCGGRDCLKDPAEVVPELHRKFMQMQAERDHFRGRVLKPQVNGGQHVSS